MSTRSCLHIETEDSTWFYLVENEDSPEDAWDWREYSTAHGPFDTLDEAMDHRADNIPGVSGSEIRRHSPSSPLPEVVQAKIAEVTAAAANKY